MDLDTALTDKSLCGSATDLLRADHEEISRLFDSYQEAMDAASSVRNALAQAICMQVELHSRVEAEVFYPSVRDEAPDLVAESVDEHREIAQTINALREADLSLETCDGLMLDLMDQVESHMAAEELELFPLLEERISPELRSLGAEIFRLKEDMVGSTEDLAARS